MISKSAIFFAVVWSGLIAGARHAYAQPRLGSLVIAGGGELPRVIYDRFAELAGSANGHLVVIPTAAHDDDLDDHSELEWYRDQWQLYRFRSITILHTRDRSQATTEEFRRPLASATGVWIGGGDQSRLATAFVGTPVESDLLRILARGGCIGGTSAGAAIQTKVMITGGNERPDLGGGFDLLPGAIVDQHFLARSRIMRLLQAIAEHPDRVGIGIDERTAIVVRDGRAEVIGESYAFVAEKPRNGSDAPKLPRIRCLGNGESMSLPTTEMP